MVVKVYISGSSGSKEVKKRQQRTLLILDSKNIKYEIIDIAEPGNEEQKDFMHNTSTFSGSTISDPNPRHPLPPQLYNDDLYCGDYEHFDLSNEVDEMEIFLKLATETADPVVTSNAEVKLGNGELHPDPAVEADENSAAKESKEEDTDVEASKTASTENTDSKGEKAEGDQKEEDVGEENGDKIEKPSVEEKEDVAEKKEENAAKEEENAAKEEENAAIEEEKESEDE